MHQSIRQYRQPRPGEIIAFLSRRANQTKNYDSKSEMQFRPCPKCSGDNANNLPIRINTKTGLWRCFKCGEVGNWFQLTQAFGEPIPVNDRYIGISYQAVDMDIVRKFVGEKRRPVHDNHYPDLLNYCLGRGIGIETLRDWRVSSKGPGAIRWPLYDLVDGRWVICNMKVKSVDGRSVTKDWFDVAGAQTDLLIGNHLLNKNGPKRCFIFEGQFDAMTAYQLGLRNVFSLPNGATNVNVNAMLRFIPDDWEIVIATDMDQAGDQAAEKFFAQLGTERIKRLKMPHKDLNDWLKADPFLDIATIEKALLGPEHFFLDETGFIKLDMSIDAAKSDRIAARTPWDEINSKLAGGLYEGQTTGLLGPSGQGKTTWVNQLGIGVAASQIPVGLISVEGSRDDLLTKLKDGIRGAYEREQWKTIESHLIISPLAGHKITSIDIIRETERLIGAGARLLIIDNLDHIFRGDSQKKSDCYAMLIDQAVRAKIHTIVIWQPHKVERDQVINSGSQKGFSMSLQDADNYLTLNRVKGGICIDIEKTRMRGIDATESKSYFDWDENKRIYVQRKRFTNSGNVCKLLMLS